MDDLATWFGRSVLDGCDKTVTNKGGLSTALDKHLEIKRMQINLHVWHHCLNVIYSPIKMLRVHQTVKSTLL